MIHPYKNDINLTSCIFSTIENTIKQSAVLNHLCYTPLYFVKGEINNGVYIKYDKHLPPPFVRQKCALTGKLCVNPKGFSNWIEYYEKAVNPFNDIDVLYVKSSDPKSNWAQLFIVTSLIKP